MTTDVLIPLDPDVSAYLSAMAAASNRAPEEILKDLLTDLYAVLGFSAPGEQARIPRTVFLRVLADTRPASSLRRLYLLVTESFATELPEEEDTLPRTLRDKGTARAFSVKFNRLLGEALQSRRHAHVAFERRNDEPTVRRKPRPRGIGVFASGHSDTSQRARKVFGEALEERYPRSEPSL
jgi:hypothetical protein